MLNTLDNREILDLFQGARYGHLGCASEGQVYVVPISFVLDGDRLLGITSAGLKIDKMRANPNVCVQVDQVERMTKWVSAIVWGTFKELDGGDRAHAAGLLYDKYGPIFEAYGDGQARGRDTAPQRLDNKPEPVIAYSITIEKMSGRRESS